MIPDFIIEAIRSVGIESTTIDLTRAELMWNGGDEMIVWEIGTWTLWVEGMDAPVIA